MPAADAAPVDRPGPASTTAAPTSPPTSAWLELEGSPHRQVSRFQVTGGGQGGTDHDHRLRRRHLDDAGDRVGHGRPQQQRAKQVADRRPG
jgi:hypothetical protein